MLSTMEKVHSGRPGGQEIYCEFNKYGRCIDTTVCYGELGWDYGLRRRVHKRPKSPNNITKQKYIPSYIKSTTKRTPKLIGFCESHRSTQDQSSPAHSGVQIHGGPVKAGSFLIPQRQLHRHKSTLFLNCQRAEDPLIADSRPLRAAWSFVNGDIDRPAHWSVHKVAAPWRQGSSMATLTTPEKETKTKERTKEKRNQSLLQGPLYRLCSFLRRSTMLQLRCVICHSCLVPYWGSPAHSDVHIVAARWWQGPLQHRKTRDTWTFRHKWPCSQ